MSLLARHDTTDYRGWTTYEKVCLAHCFVLKTDQVHTLSIENMATLRINDEFNLHEMLVDSTRSALWTSNISKVASGDNDFTYHTLNHNGIVVSQQVCLAIGFREHVTHRKDPDVFFSDAEVLRFGQPGLFIFASKDESLTGRCSMVQHCNDSIFVTVIHSDVTAMDLFELVDDGGEGDIYKLHTHFNQMKALQKESPRYFHSGLQFAIDNAILLVAKRIKAKIRSIPEVEPWEDDFSTPAKIPDVNSILAGSQIPLHTLDNGVVTIRDGTVAFHISMDGTFPQKDLVPRSAKVVFDMRDMLSFYDTEIVHVQISLGPSVKIMTIGVPIAHICYVLDLAIDLALKIQSKECESYRQLEDLLRNVCDKKTVAVIEKREQAKTKAVAIVARILKQNLSQIKTKLWRPNGVLVRKMIEADIEESSDDVCK